MIKNIYLIKILIAPIIISSFLFFVFAVMVSAAPSNDTEFAGILASLKTQVDYLQKLLDSYLIHKSSFGFAQLSSSFSSGNVLSVCATGAVYTLPSQAAAVANDGDTIEICAGQYVDAAIWLASNLTIRGVGGRAHVRDTTVGGKAIWVIQGNNTVVENIEFSGASVNDLNGAGIRQEGKGLTVRRSYFHDNENGILGGGGPESTVLVEYSEFARNGFGDGQSHNMYIDAGTFVLRYSYSHHAKIGHLVKTRALVNYILYNRLMDEANGSSSLAIDLSNGGIAHVIGNVIQQGPQTDNTNSLAFAPEGTLNRPQELYVAHNTFVNDGPDTGSFIAIYGLPDTARIVNNVFVGPGDAVTRFVAGVVAPGGVELTSNLVLPTGDPKLVDRVAYDYHLAAGSPAIDAGAPPGMGNGFALTPRAQYVHPASGQTRPIVGAIDAGAYEFGTAGVALGPEPLPPAPVIRPDTIPSTTPGALIATAQSSSHVLVLWGVSQDNRGVTGYTVRRDSTILQSALLQQYLDTGLVGGTTYTYTVQAVDAAGNPSVAASVSVTTPPAQPGAKPPLQVLAESMAPRTWAELPTNNINQTFGADGSSFTILGYAEGMSFNPITREVMYVGGDHGGEQGVQFVSYVVDANTWRRLPIGPVKWTHGYDHNTINPITGEFYSYQYYNPVISTYLNGQWTSLPPLPTDEYINCCIGLAWFPELNGGAGLVHVSGGSVLAYRPSSGAWSALARDLLMGAYQSFAEYNPVHKVVWFGGGDVTEGLAPDANRKTYKLDRNGIVTRLRDAPVGLGTYQSFVTLDPVSGKYLVFVAEGRRFFEFDVSTDTWTELPGASLNGFTTVATPLSTYGVTMFVSCELFAVCQTWLYKHAPGGGNPVPPDTTKPTVSLVAPLPNATVSNTISLSATATDNVGVAGVQFKVDGTNLGSEDTESPYSVSLNTSTLTNGPHTITAVARDRAGNTNSASVTVTVSNFILDTTPPMISNIQVVASATSAIISFTTNEPATADIRIGLSPDVLGPVSIPGTPQSTASAPRTIHQQEFSKLTPGTRYFFRITVQDQAGNTRQSAVEQFQTQELPTSENPLTPIYRVEAERRTGRTVSLKFEAPDDILARPKEYDLRYLVRDTISAVNWNTATSVPNGIIPGPKGALHQFLFPNLYCGTQYSIGIRGKDLKGNLSDLGSTLNITTKQCPPKPRILTFKLGSVILSWAQDSYTDGTLFYRIIRVTGTASPISITDPKATLVGTTTATTIADSTPQPRTTYTYAIASYSDEGEYSEMTTVTVTTPALPPPPPPPQPSPPPPPGGGGGGGGGGGSTPSPSPTPTPTPSPVPTPTTLPAPGIKYSFTKLLYFGIRDSEVTNLQRLLIAKGYLAAGNDTGYFGPLTESAVKKFQCATNIVCVGSKEDTGYGLVGTRTRAKLNEIGSTSSPQPVLPSALSEPEKQALITTLREQIKQLQIRLLELQLKLLQEKLQKTGQ